MEGKIVSAIPAPSRVSKYGINWDDYATTARFTGQPILAGTNIRETQVKSLRYRTRPPFVTDDGHIEFKLRNSTIKDDGVRYGDVYMVWIPNEPDVPTK